MVVARCCSYAGRVSVAVLVALVVALHGAGWGRGLRSCPDARSVCSVDAHLFVEPAPSLCCRWLQVPGRWVPTAASPPSARASLWKQQPSFCCKAGTSRSTSSYSARLLYDVASSRTGSTRLCMCLHAWFVRIVTRTASHSLSCRSRDHRHRYKHQARCRL